MGTVSAFRELFAQLLQRQRLSISAFAKRVECAHSFVSHILRDERRPPIDDLPRWASALGLTTEERTRFTLLAHLAHCPVEIEEEFLRLVARVERLEAQLSGKPGHD